MTRNLDLEMPPVTRNLDLEVPPVTRNLDLEVQPVTRYWHPKGRPCDPKGDPPRRYPCDSKFDLAGRRKTMCMILHHIIYVVH